MTSYNDIPVVPMNQWGDDITPQEGLWEEQQSQQPTQQKSEKKPFQPTVGDIARGAGDIIQSGYEGAKTALSLGNLSSKAADGIAAAFNPDASYADYRAESEARRYKPKSGAGKLTYMLMKYGTLPASGTVSSSLKAGAVLDTALYEKSEGHLFNDNIKWDDNLFNVADRAENAVEGLGAGFALKGLTKAISKFAPPVAEKLGKLFNAKSHEEVKTLTQELEPVLKQVEVKATVDDIVDQVGNDKVDVFKATQELPYEDGMRALKEFDYREEAQLLEVNPEDNILHAGAVESTIKEPHQMTKDEFRQSLAGEEMRVFEDESKVIGKVADRHLEETLDKTWSERGLAQADNENERQWLQRVIDSYKTKWENPDVNVKVGIRDLGKKAGYVETAEDGTVSLVVNKNNLYKKAALRHELEHLHDVITNKVPTDGTHFSRYGNEDTFAADYVHKKNITQAVRGGKSLPADVAKEYADIIPNLDQVVKEAPASPEQLKLDFNNTPEAQAYHQEVKTTGEVTETAIKTLNKSDDVQGIYQTLSTSSEKHNPFKHETAEEFVSNSNKFFKELFDEINPHQNYDEFFNIAEMSQEQIRSARFLLGNLRKVQQETSKEALKLAEVFITTPHGASKARMMETLSAMMEKGIKIDTAIRGSFSEAGRLLQSAQREASVIEDITLNDNFAETILKKDLTDKGLDVSFFDNVVKEATDGIQKLFAQSQGQKITADSIEELLVKAFGDDLNVVGADRTWLKNEALRIFEDYQPGIDLEKLVRSSVRNTIDFSKHLDNIKGLISSSAAPDFWSSVKKRGWNNASGYFIQNLLSGVSTSVKNTFGGVSKTYFDNTARRLAGTREERELAALEFEALGRNFHRALELSKAVFKNDPLYGRVGQYIESMDNLPSHLLDDNKLPMIGSRESWGVDEDYVPDSTQDLFLKTTEHLGNLSHKLSRWLPMTDEFLTSWNYLAKADSEATANARKYLQQTTKGNYTVEQVRELADKELNSGRYFNPETGRPANVDMLRESRESSLVNPITSEESKTTFIYGTADKLTQLRKDFPATKFFVPFVNALARLGQNTIDTLPGLAHIPGVGTYQAEIKAGGRRAALAQGKVTMGMYVLASSVMLGMTGKITGSEPMDRGEAQALRSRGWKPYSIIIDNGESKTYISYKDLEPFASLVGIGVDLSQNIHRLPEDGAGKVIQLTVASLMKNVTDKTFFTSLANQADILSPDSWRAKTGGWISSMASGVIPGSNFFNQAGNIVAGDTLKAPRDFTQNLISRIPFANQTLPEKLNDLGEPIDVSFAKRTTGVGVSTTENNKVNNELTELAQYGLKLPAPKTDKNGVNLESYVGDKGITAYEAIHRNKATLKIGGKNLRQSLDSLISSSFYQSLPNGQDIEGEGYTIDYTDKYTKIGQIHRIYQQYLDASVNDIMWQQNFKEVKTGIPLKEDYITVKRNKVPDLQSAFGD